MEKPFMSSWNQGKTWTTVSMACCHCTKKAAEVNPLLEGSGFRKSKAPE